MSTNHPSRSARGAQRGFSFIEILIVMGIIATLAGLTVVAINIWVRKGPEFHTKQRVQKLQNLTETWKLKFQGWYPPMDLTRMQSVTGNAPEVKKVPNGTNEGIESLFQALHWPGFATEAGIGDAEVGNTDDDNLDKDAARGKDLLEIVDAWNNPLVYFPHTEYAGADQDPPTYVRANGTTFEPKPWKATGGFAMANSCQVFSIGPDQEPNTDDDIKGWE